MHSPIGALYKDTLRFTHLSLMAKHLGARTEYPRVDRLELPLPKPGKEHWKIGEAGEPLITGH